MYRLLFENGLLKNSFDYIEIIDRIVEHFKIPKNCFNIISLPSALPANLLVTKLDSIEETDIIVICEDNYEYFKNIIDLSKIKYDSLYIFRDNNLYKIEKNKELLA